MKTIKVIFLGVFLMFLSNSSFAQASNDGYYTGKAKAALNDCLTEAHKANQEVNSYVVHDDGSCLNSVTVHFYGTPHCPPNMICIQVIYPIGSVTFDCYGNIVVINCENGVIQ